MSKKVWIYQWDSAVDSSTADKILNEVKQFLSQWQSHKEALSGWAKLQEGQFLLVGTKEDSLHASGCSIDTLQKGMHSILFNSGITPLDAGIIFYKNNGQICKANFLEIENLIKTCELSPETIIFDQTLGFTENPDFFEVKLKESWLSRYLPLASEPQIS